MCKPDEDGATLNIIALAPGTPHDDCGGQILEAGVMQTARTVKEEEVE